MLEHEPRAELGGGEALVGGGQQRVERVELDGEIDRLERLVPAGTRQRVQIIAVLRRDVARSRLGERQAPGPDRGPRGRPVPDAPNPDTGVGPSENLTAADALLVVLAEQLGEPLATKDGALARAAHEHTGIAVRHLGGPAAT